MLSVDFVMPEHILSSEGLIRVISSLDAMIEQPDQLEHLLKIVRGLRIITQSHRYQDELETLLTLPCTCKQLVAVMGKSVKKSHG